MAKASRRRMIIGLGGTLLVLAIVFWFIFTFIVDPQVVIDAFLSLDLLLLEIVAILGIITVAWMLFNAFRRGRRKRKS